MDFSFIAPLCWLALRNLEENDLLSACSGVFTSPCDRTTHTASLLHHVLRTGPDTFVLFSDAFGYFAVTKVQLSVVFSFPSLPDVEYWEGPMKAGSALAIVALCITFTPLTATAGEQEDHAACMNDALTVCSQFIPDRERVASCLISNPTLISEACRTALLHFDRPAASPANVTRVSSPVASRAKLSKVDQRAASRAKLTKANQPLALVQPKLTTANRSVASRAKLTAVR